MENDEIPISSIPTIQTPPTQISSQRSKLVPLFVLVILLAISGSYLAFAKYKSIWPFALGASTTSLDTSNWKTYSNDEYEFKYSPIWAVSTTTGDITVSLHKINPEEKYDFMFIQSGYFLPAPTTESLEENLNFLKSVGVDGSTYKEVPLENGKAFLRKITDVHCCADGPPHIETILASKYYVYYLAYQTNESLDEAENSLLKILSTFKFKDIFHIIYNPKATMTFYNWGGITEYSKDESGYLIEYPKDAEISFVGEGTGTSCTVIRYKSGYVAISKNSSVPCITTEDGLAKDEIGVGGSILANGKSYPIFDHFNADNTYGFATIKINSIITINFGAIDNKGAKYFDALNDVGPIIESFKLYSYEWE